MVALLWRNSVPWEEPFKLNVFSDHETPNVYKPGAWSFIGLFESSLRRPNGPNLFVVPIKCSVSDCPHRSNCVQTVRPDDPL